MLPAPAEKPPSMRPRASRCWPRRRPAQLRGRRRARRDPPPSTAADQCRSEELKWLIGKAKAKIPAARDGETRRILCTTCAATMDYLPTRLNILYDKKTGIVRELKCG